MACSVDRERQNSQTGQCWAWPPLAFAFFLYPGQWPGGRDEAFMVVSVAGLSLGSGAGAEGLPTNERWLAAWLLTGEQAASPAPSCTLTCGEVLRPLPLPLPHFFHLGDILASARGFSFSPGHHPLCPAPGINFGSWLLALRVLGWPRSFAVAHGGF